MSLKKIELNTNANAKFEMWMRIQQQQQQQSMTTKYGAASVAASGRCSSLRCEEADGAFYFSVKERVEE